MASGFHRAEIRAEERLNEADMANIRRRQRAANIDSLILESFRDDG